MKINFYLKHPLMAMCDRRMKNLVKQEGLKGTGAYWFILEILGTMPNQCGQFEDLRPFCKQLKISFAYIKKIILEYQLFSMDEEGNFEPEELNPPHKTEQKATKNTQEFDNSDTKNDENRQKASRNSTNPESQEFHKALIHRDLTNSTSIIKENIKDITTTATTEEKEETAAVADDILLKLEIGVKAKPEIRLCIPIACSTTSETTQVTVRNDTGHQPKPRSSVLTSCVIGGAQLRHWGYALLRPWSMLCCVFKKIALLKLQK